jgi:transcriptional regulator with XRE-family HTH domain
MIQTTTQLGKRLRELRVNARLTQRELGDRSHVSHSYISQLETGKRKNSTLDVLREITRALSYPLDRLLRDAGLLPQTGDSERDDLIWRIVEGLDRLPEDVMRAKLREIDILAEHYRQQSVRRDDSAQDRRTG